MTTYFSTPLITVLLLIYLKGLLGEQCESNDCLLPSECPAMVYKVRTVLTTGSLDSINKFRDFVTTIACDGYRGYICCSKVSLLDTESLSKNFSIENHPNLGLLPNSCGPLRLNRILLPIEQNYPWLVLIAYNNNFGCAGTLINDRYVLTSAECVKDKNIQGVRLGESDVRRCGRRSNNYFIQQDRDCDNIEHQDVPVETVIIHNEYNSRSGENDIALLRLDNAADFSKDNIAPICLPKTLSLLQQNITKSYVEISDWKLDEGYYERLDELPLIFGCKVPKAGEIDCGEINHPCKGEPGSPLMVGSDISESDSAYVQYGVLLNARFPCYTDMPRKYTDVTKYMEWILNSISP